MILVCRYEVKNEVKTFRHYKNMQNLYHLQNVLTIRKFNEILPL